MGEEQTLKMPAPGDIYSTQGAKNNATFKKMEQFRKQAVMLDAIEDYKAEMEAEMAGPKGGLTVGDGKDPYGPLGLGYTCVRSLRFPRRGRGH